MSSSPIDGIYAVYITGQSGNGLVMLVMQSGKVTGVDAAGVLFDGEYEADKTNREFYNARVTVKAPPGGMTVQGVSTGPSGITYEVSYSLPMNFAAMDYLEVRTPLGPVNAKFQKLRAL